MESVLKKFLVIELMFTIMELLVAEQKRNILKGTFSKETKSLLRALSSHILSFCQNSILVISVIYSLIPSAFKWM